MQQFQWPHIEACSGLRQTDIEAAARVYRESEATIACYGMGYAAPLGRARHSNAEQPVAPPWQHRQAGRRHLPGVRPFERPGPAHGRDHGEARARPAGPPRGAVRLHPAAQAGPRHCRNLRGRARRQRQGVHRPRRQLYPRHSRDRHHGARLAAPPNDGADRHRSIGARSSMAGRPICCPASAASRSTDRPPACNS